MRKYNIGKQRRIERLLYGHIPPSIIEFQALKLALRYDVSFSLDTRTTTRIGTLVVITLTTTELSTYHPMTERGVLPRQSLCRLDNQIYLLAKTSLII
jgi:hypothetical protein